MGKRGPTPKVGENDILGFMISHDSPAFVVSEIAEEFDVEPPTARNRMEEMVDDGLLERKKPSERVVFYWPTAEGQAYYVEHSSSDS